MQNDKPIDTSIKKGKDLSLNICLKNQDEKGKITPSSLC